jgi:hypothetical protein
VTWWRLASSQLAARPDMPVPITAIFSGVAPLCVSMCNFLGIKYRLVVLYGDELQSDHARP